MITVLGSFLWGGLFYLFCHREWLVCSREKAVGFVVCIIRVPEVPSGEGCLLGWRARVPVLDGWLCASRSAGSTALWKLRVLFWV